MVWKELRELFFPEPVDRAIRAELKGRVLHMYYPLSTGEVVHKQLSFPDAVMAHEGHQRFLRDVADQLPGHARRKHLRSVRLNNELIGHTSLDWKLSEENGPQSIS